MYPAPIPVPQTSPAPVRAFVNHLIARPYQSLQDCEREEIPEDLPGLSEVSPVEGQGLSHQLKFNERV
jgi:hypothetical protein